MQADALRALKAKSPGSSGALCFCAVGGYTCHEVTASRVGVLPLAASRRVSVEGQQGFEEWA
jgi:hypothetical protein